MCELYNSGSNKKRIDSFKKLMKCECRELCSTLSFLK
ncbi:protein of unknown function [Cyanobium sp. NIES-981]|nr:protein of unknown function [Cyanobium sp. NIES-981]